MHGYTPLRLANMHSGEVLACDDPTQVGTGLMALPPTLKTTCKERIKTESPPAKCM